MSTDEPMPPAQQFASRAERRRYERQLMKEPPKRQPLTRKQALELVVQPVRAQERPEHHEYQEPTRQSPPDTVFQGPKGPRAVLVYTFTVYRRDGLRACMQKVPALLAFRHAQAGESTLEAARRMAKVSGTEMLIDDVLNGEPAPPEGQ